MPLNNKHSSVAFERSPIVIGLIILLMGAGLFLAWQLSHAIILILAGIVVAVLLDAAASGFANFSRLPRKASLILLLVTVLGALSVATWWGGSTLWLQLNELSQALRGVWDFIRSEFAARAGFLPKDVVSGMLPNPSTVLGGAQAAFSAVGSTLVIIALGVFFALNPPVYVTALVSLLPKSRRSKFASTLVEAAGAMRRWLLGQGVSMCVIFVTTWVALGMIEMPYSFLLALLAGLLVFIPTIGPIVAGLLIISTGLATSMTLALYGAGVYLVIQTLETYMLTPFVQKEAVALPPGFTLAAQLVFGALFGIVGVAIAVPLAAAVKVLVEVLYVEDELGGSWPN